MSEALKGHVLSILNNYKVGTLATIRNDQPFSRFMMFFHEELVLYTATNKETHKAEDIEKNPHVHILLRKEDSWNSPYVEIEAEATVEETKTLKEKFWNEQLKEWIDSPEDPNYLLLQLTPKKIYYYEKPGSKAQVL